MVASMVLVALPIRRRTAKGDKDCFGTSNLAETVDAGDTNGYQTNPDRACGVTDGLYARDPNTGTGGTESCGTGNTPDTRNDQHHFDLDSLRVQVTYTP